MKVHNRYLYLTMNVVAFIYCITVNFLAITLPINGNDTRVLSDKYTNLFVPAPQTFAIWSVIYLGLIAFLGISLYSFYSKNEDNLQKIDRIGPWFFWSSIANGLWLIAWHYEQLLLSICVMLGLLYCLIKIYVAVHGLRPMVWRSSLWLLVPFSLYLGWISVATIANISAYLVSIAWSGWGINPDMWAKIMISIAAILGIVMLIKRQDVIYVAVILWALYGIYLKNFDATALPAQTTSKYALTTLIFLNIYTFLMLIGRKFYMFESSTSAKGK
jgi:hypothetical protein